jgi:hypothetical protein
MSTPASAHGLPAAAPAGTVTLAGKDTSAPFEVDRKTVAAESAKPLSMTVPRAGKPPNWLAGLTGSTHLRFLLRRSQV